MANLHCVYSDIDQQSVSDRELFRLFDLSSTLFARKGKMFMQIELANNILENLNFNVNGRNDFFCLDALHALLHDLKRCNNW